MANLKSATLQVFTANDLTDHGESPCMPAINGFTSLLELRRSEAMLGSVYFSMLVFTD